MNFLNNVMTIVNNMTIKQRPDSRYEGRITREGIRKSFYGKTKSEVKQKAKEYLTKVENGYRDPKKISLNDYAQYWLTTYKYGKIEPSSFTRLHRVFENHIKNTIGHKMIGDIKTSDIQGLINEYANPKSNNKNALALSGLKRIMQFLTPCFKMAIKEEIVYINPCDDVKLPSESYICRATRQQYSLNDEEIQSLRESALKKQVYKNEYKNRNSLVVLLILNLGLRAGEAMALEWSDVDIGNKIIRINKTVQSGIRDFEGIKDTVIYDEIKRSTKTKSGMRSLQLNEAAIYYLKEMKDYDLRNGITTKYVCCNKNGGRNNHRNLQHCLNRVVADANIDKHVTLHTLRHTFGSTLIRRGVNIEVVSKLMGHANITITYNKYIHTIQEEEAKAMNMVIVC